MRMTKRWYQSTTIQGQIAACIGLIATLFDLPILKEEIETTVAVAFTIIGICMSIYGRIKTNGERITT